MSVGIPSATILSTSDFDFAKAEVEDVYFAHVVRVPFRFRVTSPYHCRFEIRGRRYDIWVRNQPVRFAPGPVPVPSVLLTGAPVEELWSTIAVIPNDGSISPDELLSVRNCGGNLDSVIIESGTEQSFSAMQALNAFIVGYHTATGELFGGWQLRTFTVDSYMSVDRCEVTLIGIPLTHWTQETIGELFDRTAARRIRAGISLQGELSDLPPERLAGLTEAIDRIDTFYFYELAFEAKAKVRSGDDIGALLMAVAALEGVHSAFVTHSLSARLPSDRTGDDKNLEENFIKELGFSLCNKLTPYLFMETGNRPPNALIQQAATAVKYRNEIMHALRNSAGTYRIRTRTNAELSSAFAAALQLYEFYRKAFERVI